ncbi:ATP-binding cassette domain-containing protein [Buchananella hordeovulneris]|uniref:ATP-binding cassette domain-containing protein n=1 Tax=Buchananella hordeovulneris TaxID=52770 RepID=UPI000F5EA6BF|nr:ATP-binding cassette domain-containing protein [Buchananella hordeovulneris]RRD53340.1 ATP-binding cassette domain-containing protein [Buchananella hordeovulneris]
MDTQQQLAIDARGLTKSFGSNHVLCGLDLQVPSSTIFALLGSNGAGKTTTVNILTTLLSADSGTALVAGFDVNTQADKVRASIGVTGQFAAIDGLLTGKENLELMARLAHLGRSEAKMRVSELIELFDLSEAANKRSSTYSGGMRRRLDLAMSLMLSPAVVFLDEPTTGVDPRGRATLWQIVRNLASVGTTVFLTTQYLEEADQLADRIAVIEVGTIVAAGTPTELKSRVGQGHLLLELQTESAFNAGLKLVPHATHDRDSLEIRIAGATSAESIQSTLLMFSQADIPIGNLRVVTPDLDDVFFALTNSTPERKI